MVFGFSDFSLRLIYEAVERWEDIVEDVVGDLAAELPVTDAASFAGSSLFKSVAPGANERFSALPVADVIGWECDLAPLVDLTPLVLPASVASTEEPGASATIEAQRTDIGRVFKGYEWVARYEAIPGPSMGWQHLVENRREDDRHERDKRAAALSANDALNVQT